MSPGFVRPHFGDRHIELRFENNEVCIYGTPTGLEKLMAFCKQLLDNPRRGHIHLEDYELLTSDSLKGALAVFVSEE